MHCWNSCHALTNFIQLLNNKLCHDPMTWSCWVLMQLLVVYLWLHVKLITMATKYLYTYIGCKIDRLNLLADVPRIMVHLAEFCNECHLNGGLFPGPLGQGGISCSWSRFVSAAISSWWSALNLYFDDCEKLAMTSTPNNLWIVIV